MAKTMRAGNNVENSVPRLTLGTLLTLLYCGRKGPKNRTSQGKFTLDLLRLLSPCLNDPGDNTSKSESSLWMNCKKATSDWIPLGRESFIKSVEEEYNNHFPGVLKRAGDFISRHFDLEDEFRITRTFRAILDVIDKDITIGKTEVMRINGPEGGTRKGSLKAIRSLKYEYTLIGSLLYVLTDRDANNEDGKNTIESWDYNFNDLNNTCYFYKQEQDWTAQIQFESVGAEELSQTPSREAGSQPSAPERIQEYLDFLKDKLKEVIPIFQERPKPFYSQYVNSSIAIGGGDILESPTAASVRDQISNYVIVVGDGGLGKTMLVHHLALDAALHFRECGMVPMVVKLKDYNEGPKDVLTFIYTAISASFPFTLEDIKTMFKDKCVLLLLDGLDEINPKYLQLFQRNLEAFIDQNPGNTFVMSSRGYGSFETYGRFTVAKLRPLTMEQAIELTEKAAPSEAVKERLIKELKDGLFMEHIQLTSNPMMLTVLMNTFRHYPRSPFRLHSFFQKAYDALSARHDADKDLYKRELQTKLQPDDFRELLIRFCTKLYFTNEKSFTKEKGIEVFNLIKKFAKLDSVKATDFLIDLEVSFCMVGQDANGYYFRNETFMEYFVACQLLKYSEAEMKRLIPLLTDAKNPKDGDKMLEMLLDMNRSGVEKNLFYPYLKGIFDECDDSVDDGAFMTFLSLTYPKIQYSIGDCPEEKAPISPYFLYNAIRKAAGLNLPPEIGDWIEQDLEIEFAVDEHYPASKAPGGFISKSQFANRDDLSKEDLPEPVGWDIELEVRTLLTEREKYQPLIDEIANEGEGLFQEYLTIREYFEAIKEEKEAIPDGLDALLS